MRLQLLDKKNCQALLPQFKGLNIDRLLDDFLHRKVNSSRGYSPDYIDKLITHNRETSNQLRSSQRLYKSSLEILLIYKFESSEAEFLVKNIPYNSHTKFYLFFEDEGGIKWKIIIPLQFLLKGWGNANYGYQCYSHSISKNISRTNSFAKMLKREFTGSNDYTYVGITGRNWLLRFDEHMGEVRRGSKREFYKEWRKNQGLPDVHYISQLVEINLTYDEAMNWEEDGVDKVPNSLNMIPGGFKGLKYLHELGITNREDINLKDREKAITRYIKENPRKGVPNPFISELWKDDEYYYKIMEAREDRLSADQVRRIRKLANDGWSVAKITEEVGALNDPQVKRVIAGETYDRIK